jgi:hypothetical protein
MKASMGKSRANVLWGLVGDSMEIWSSSRSSTFLEAPKATGVYAGVRHDAIRSRIAYDVHHSFRKLVRRSLKLCSRKQLQNQSCDIIIIIIIYTFTIHNSVHLASAP